MDKATLEKLGGVIEWLEVPYEIKLSAETENNQWETAGATMRARVHVGSDADPEVVYKATYEWLKELAVETVGPRIQAIKKKVGKPLSKQAPLPEPEEEDVPFVPANWCTIHKCEMKMHQKDNSTWYSHKAGDAWCKGK